MKANAGVVGSAGEREASIWKWITLVLLFGPAVLMIFLLALG